MFDPTHLVEHWGYAAILAIEIFGNLGIPLPEEEALIVAGYFVWVERLWFPLVLLVGGTRSGRWRREALPEAGADQGLRKLTL